MSINLPGYGTAGWGATLNNYLRSLEKRLNVIEGKVNSNTTVEEQILAVSRYAGSGLTTTSTKIKRGTSDITSTISIYDGNVLSFENLSYYIQASLTNTGGSYITFDTAKTWTFNEDDLNFNQSALLVIDQDGVISLLPKIVNGNATGTTPTNLNFCRLGYVTKLDDDFFFTPAPEIASLSTSSKFEFWSSPKIRTQRQNSNTEYIGSFVFGAEGLGYFTNSNTNNTNNIYINDFNLYNSYQYSDPSGYYTVDKDGVISYSEYDIDSDDTVDSLFTTQNNKIRFYYVTLTGKAFCYIHEIEEGEQIPVTSQELGAYQLNHEQMGLHVLFDNYSYICPVEVCRLTRNEFGSIVSYSNTYNGFPPQLHNTPVFGSNNAVMWNQFHFMQNSETSPGSSQYNTLSIRPIVNTGDGAVNSVVTIDTTASITEQDNEVLLMEHDYKKPLNIKSDSNISVTGSQFLVKTPNIQFVHSSTNWVGYEYDSEATSSTVVVSGAATERYEKNLGTVTNTTNITIDNGYSVVGTYETGLKNSSYTKDNFSFTIGTGAYAFSVVSFNSTTGVLTYKLESILTSVTATAEVKLITYNYNGTVTVDFTPTSATISEGHSIKSFENKNISYVLRGAAKSGDILEATITYGHGEAYHDYKGTKIYLNKNSSTYIEASSESTIFNTKNLEIACPSILMDANVNIIGLATFQDNLTVYGTTSLRDNLDVKGTVTWTSDRNLKTNITPLSLDSIHIIDSIPLYNYALKSTPDKQTIGLMAQDLQQYLPQLVHTAEDGRLTIEETKLVYVCMDALKKANERIVFLEGKVNDLCNKISQYHL